MNRRIVMLAGQAYSTNIVYHALSETFGDIHVILENPVSRWLFLKKRLKKLGTVRVSGQILFAVFILPFVRMQSRRRCSELMLRFNFDDTPIDLGRVTRVSSVNSEQTAEALRMLQPDCIVVTGTRIITEKILNAVSCPFINIHVGITPLYRGVYGAYWALVRHDAANCGVTVHFIDKGVDTGQIIDQAAIKPSSKDNILTYEMLQLEAGMPLLRKAVEDVFQDSVNLRAAPLGKSMIWSHPTFWEYLYYWFTKKIK